MPGYDVFNPLEVVPEFVADIGIKKGEKVEIQSSSQLYDYSTRLLKAIDKYEKTIEAPTMLEQ